MKTARHFSARSLPGAHFTSASPVHIEAAVGGTGGNDSLTGTADNDKLVGFGGDDTLDGGAGADIMTGGTGNDTYVVDNSADSVVERSGEGTDSVLASVSYQLATQVENLTLTGSAAINGAGNSLANTITGNAAANVLDGRGGIDAIDGGDSGDLYIVGTAAAHAAAEFSDTGTSGVDEIRFTATVASKLTVYAGDTGIERVVLGTGTAATANTSGTVALSVDATAGANGLTIIGNAGANSITGTGFADSITGGAGNDSLIGGTGDDTLSGGAGADQLTGGTGTDTFVFDSATGTGNIDTIIDFSSGTDHIALSQSVFAALTALGAITSAQFFASASATAAHDADDRIVYNTTTGALYYDADGQGHAAAVQIAIIGKTTHPTLAFGDFEVVA